MDQATCRDRMRTLISEESSALTELAAMLDREHGHLTANDLAGLDSAMRERQRCVARILRVDEERRALCRALGRPHDLKGLELLLRWCDPQGTLAAEWARCSAAAARCRGLNDRNGALVGARLKHVQARLGALLASRRESITYGPRGMYSEVPAGRIVATEV